MMMMMLMAIKMKLSSWGALLLLAPCLSLAAAPAASGSVIVQENATTTASNGTSVENPSAFTTTIKLDVKQYWNLFVGPVQTANINTTVEATPVPTSELVPPPPLYYASFPAGHQVAQVAKNESWKFPKGFFWGVASAAYQAEGAVQAEGRGPSIWDVFTHRATSLTLTNDTADVSDNHYYLYKQDIARIAALGVKTYSFSISWSRIFPYGKGAINELALAHYEDVIDTCIKYGIEPAVTLYHWDLPLYLQNLYGGWLSEEIVDDYVAYAKVIFERYGNKVPHWFTINEPLVFCSEYPFPSGYFAEVSVPPSQQQYYCSHHALLAHAKAYHLAKSLGLKGTLAMKNNGGYKIPLTDSADDALATQRAWDFNEGRFSGPAYINGDYPSTYKTFASSIGLEFTEEQKALINGTGDIYAHDAYTSSFYYAPDVGVSACLSDPTNSLYPGCFNSTNVGPTGWLIGAASDQYSTWLNSATDWVPAFLHYIQKTWPSGGIVVSEFGFSEPYEELRTSLPNIVSDPIRSMYYRDYMKGILMAISEGVNVVGSIAWAITDNLEWASGYNTRFGLQYVNFTTQERSYKASFFEYVNAFKEYAEDPVVPVYVPGK